MPGSGTPPQMQPQQQQVDEFPEAFMPGKDYEAVNGVDHAARTVSRMTQQEWDQYVATYGQDLTASEYADIMKDWDGNGLYGYVRTTNAMELNKQLFQNPNKTPDQIFSKRTKQGKRDLATVQTLDKAIANHVTPANGTYYRFCNPKSLQRSYGLSDSQIALVMQAPSMNAQQLAQLNTALQGSKCINYGYTSVSANRSLNAFKNPSAVQSKGYVIERRIAVKQGTNAFAPRLNAQESEVIFGRKFSASFSHITVEGNHIVIHERH